jgi:nucleotide-binding universal stress UspA family protein
MKLPKVNIRKILYTTDLHERARYSFAYAASLAKRYGAELTLFHVVETDPDVDARVIGYISENLWEEIKTRNLDEARNILVKAKTEDDTYIKECVGDFCKLVQKDSPEHGDLTYNIVTKSGHPVEQILKEAEAGDYDLIVMGSHGKGNLPDAMIGDVSRRVVRRSKIPVLMVRHKGTEEDE